MCQTHHQVILQQALDYNVLVNLLQIKVNGHPVHHLRLVMLQVVIHDYLKLTVRDVLYLTVLNELRQSCIKDLLRSLVAYFIVSLTIRKWNQRGDDFILNDLNLLNKYIKKEGKLFRFAKELERHDDKFEEFLIGDNIFNNFRNIFNLQQFIRNELNRQELNILTQLFLPELQRLILITVLLKLEPLLTCGGIPHPQIELVYSFINSDQEDHHRLIPLLHLHMVRYPLPIAVNVHSELLLSQVVYFVTWILVLECVRISDQRLLVDQLKLLTSLLRHLVLYFLDLLL